MKILHILSQHPESTGSGYYLQNIIRQAAQCGHQNYLVAGVSANWRFDLDCIARESCGFVGFDSGTLNFAIPGMSDVMPYKSSRFSALTGNQLAAYEQAFTEQIGLAAKRFPPDIIHTHHLWIVTSVARQLLPNTPLVTSCHSTDLRQFVQCPHLRERVLAPCRKIDRVLSLSREQAARITELYGIPGERIDIMGGGYDEGLFTFHPKEQPRPVQFLYAGKLSFAKGADWLLRTMNRLGDSSLPLHLHLAGSGAGEEEERCLELAQQAGPARVTVHGRISQPELAALMRSCHVFILPSFYEGLPLVLLEAMASGCRIITTDLPGCRELLGAASSDLVSFVKLPAMPKVDQPHPEDREMLEMRLAEAMARMAERVKTSPTPDPQEIRQITSQSGWRAVFQRILASYRKAMAVSHRC